MRQVLTRDPHANGSDGMLVPVRPVVVHIPRSITSSATRLWMALAFVAALTAAAFVVLVIGATARGIDDALLVTGRISFVLFWPAYAAGAAAELFASPFRCVKHSARTFGLAFASAHIVHLGLVAWLCYMGAAPPIASFIFFGIAVLWTYVLALLSVRRLQKAVGRRVWRVISFLGAHYIAFAFAADFLRFPPNVSLKYLIGYLPFAALAVGGAVLRVCAWAARFVSARVHLYRETRRAAT